jgi:phosphoribosylanthranilate isomerase
MLIKVCGINNQANATELSGLGVDYMGMIFYEKSARKLTGKKLNTSALKRVGVFVNESVDNVVKQATLHELDVVQLHGSESPSECLELKSTGLQVWKAFAVANQQDVAASNAYAGFCDGFLFDAKGELPGGNGTTFNWSLLTSYCGETPFWLSGGINETHVSQINELQSALPNMLGVDVNSGFEIAAGQKDINKLSKFINELKSNGNY